MSDDDERQIMLFWGCVAAVLISFAALALLYLIDAGVI